MYYVTKEFNISAGHRLSKHKGDCRFIHGHNYKIEITMYAGVLEGNTDMVMDFSRLKNVVLQCLNKYDHCIMLNSKDPVAEKIEEYSKVITFRNDDPTAEVFAEHLFFELNHVLKNIYEGVYKIHSVKVWETETAMAEYRSS